MKRLKGHRCWQVGVYVKAGDDGVCPECGRILYELTAMEVEARRERIVAAAERYVAVLDARDQAVVEFEELERAVKEHGS